MKLLTHRNVHCALEVEVRALCLQVLRPFNEETKKLIDERDCVMNNWTEEEQEQNVEKFAIYISSELLGYTHYIFLNLLAHPISEI